MGNAPFLALLIVVAVLCVHRGRPGAFVLALLLILMSREDAVFLVGALAIYAWWTAGWRRLGIAALLASGAWTVWLLKVLMPWMSATHTSHPVWGAYRWLAKSPSAMVWTALSRPVLVFRHLVDESLPSLLQALAPFGVLPFIGSPAWILLLGLTPALMTGGYVGEFRYHHAYPAVAVAAVIAIEAARAVDRLLSSRHRLRLAVVLGVPMAALLLHITLGYSPLTPSFGWSEYWPTPHTRALWAALRLVPSGVALAGSGRLTVHRLVGRRPACAWEHVSLRTVHNPPVLWCDEWDAPLNEPFILIESPRPSRELHHLLTASSYAVIFDQHDVALLRLGGDTSANTALTRWAVGEVPEAFGLPRQIGSAVADPLARGGLAVRAPRGSAGFVVYGWYVWACAGPHELVVRLRGGPRWKAGSIGNLELVADRGTRRLAARHLEQSELDPGEYREFAVAVTLPEAGRVEGRIQSTGAAAFWVDALTLFAVSPSGAIQAPGEACGAATTAATNGQDAPR
jgi:hypothetical protein